MCRRGPPHAGSVHSRIRRDGKGTRRGGRSHRTFRGQPQVVAALSAPRDMRQTVGGGDHRHGAGWWFRALPGVPSPGRGRERKHARGIAGNQDRSLSWRRRDATHRPHDATGRCAPVLAQGRPTSPRAGQGHEAHRRYRARRRCRDARQGVDQDRRSGQGAVGHGRLPAARRTCLFQGRHDDVLRRQRDLPARNLRQLPRCARRHASRLRRPTAAHGCRATRGVALVCQNFALAGSGGHDPHLVRVRA